MIDLLRKREEGVALILTLLITAILVTLIVEVNYSTQVGLRIAGNFRNDLQAGYLAKSGVNIVISYLKFDVENTDTDNLDEDWAKPYPPIPVGDGFVQVVTEDESAKINVNVMGDEKAAPKIREALSRALSILFERKDVDMGILDAIMDWVDPDGETRPDGAEDDYYGSLDPPYACKNGPLDTLSELRMIKGVTDEVYGKIFKYLTIYSKDGIININTVDMEVLMCLDEGIDGPMAVGIKEYREETPFGGQNWQEAFRDVINNDDVYNRISPIIGVTSNAFSVESTGRVERVEKKIRAVINREEKQISCRYWRTE
jgi:general secretion pathway protein K